jgi:GNAT superfamily N-acetyltransferase
MLINLKRTDSGHSRLAAEIWNRACGNCFTVSVDFVRYNLEPIAGLRQEGQIAVDSTGASTGFVIASVLVGNPLVSPPSHGWIDAIAVLPEYQGRGHGSALMNWAEEWLSAQGCTQVSLGSSIRPFTPGLPPDLLSEAFFTAKGFRNSEGKNERALLWDVAADLAAYEPPSAVHKIDSAVRPAMPGEEEAFLGFLRREFPGRWYFEVGEFLDRAGRISDFMLLWTERGVDGFCQLTFEDSRRPLERYYPYGLPRPWGQLGPIGVSQDIRGRGYGAAVLDAGLRRLRTNGVRGCVIDWTRLLDFYGKFGFSAYREYLPMSKWLV